MSLIGSLFYHLRGGAIADPRLASLASVESSVVFDMDATLEDSYDGSSQTWANLVAAPADGSDQTDYDFWVGIDGTSDAFEPTFNGTVGDTEAHWTNPGGDFFNLKSGANPSFLDGLHQIASTQDWWACFVYRASATTSASTNFAKTRTSADGMQINNAGGGSPEFRLIQRNSGGQTISDSNPNYQTNDNAWNIFIVSRDTSTGTSHFWINSSTETVSDAIAYSSGTDPAGIPMRLFDIADSDTRFVHASMGNTKMTDGIAAAIMEQLETRHGRTYI